MIHNGVKGNKFKMLDHNINTRYNDGYNIDLIRPRNEHVRKSSFYVGTSFWNDLNLDLRELDIIPFRNEIKNKIRTGEIQIPFF